MTTVVTIQRPDRSTDHVQILGWNNLSDPKRKRGKARITETVEDMLPNEVIE